VPSGPSNQRLADSRLPMPAAVGEPRLGSKDLPLVSSGTPSAAPAQQPYEIRSPGFGSLNSGLFSGIPNPVLTAVAAPEPTFESVHLLLSSLGLSAPVGPDSSPGVANQSQHQPSSSPGRLPLPQHLNQGRGYEVIASRSQQAITGPSSVPPPPRRQPKSYEPAVWRRSQLEAMQRALTCGVSLNQAFAFMGIREAEEEGIVAMIPSFSKAAAVSPSGRIHSEGDGDDLSVTPSREVAM